MNMRLAILLPVSAILFISFLLEVSANEIPEQQQLVKQFKQLAAELPYLSPALTLRDYPEQNGRESKKIQDLIRHADLLPIELLRSESSRERSLACVVFGLSDRTDVLPHIAALDRDVAAGIPYFLIYDGGPRHNKSLRYVGEPRQVSEWANYALKRKLDVAHVRLFIRSKDAVLPSGLFRDWWKTIRHPQLLPSQWQMRYSRTLAWEDSLAELKKQILTLPSPHKQVIAIHLLSYYHDYVKSQQRTPPPPLISEEEIEALFSEIDPKIRREMAAGTYDYGYGDDSLWTANSITGEIVKKFILKGRVDKMLTPDDARWLIERIEHVPAIKTDGTEFIALSKLDPKSALPTHARWLQRFIESRLAQEIAERKDFGDEAALLDEDIEFWATKVLELLTLYGQPAVPYVAEFFYGRGWKFPASQDHLGYLLMFQKQLVEQLAAKHAKLARPTLRAVVADAKFLELGWAGTRAIAEVADAHVLRPERKEPDAHPAVADVLKLQHALDAEAFDLATAAAAGKPPPDGEAVVRAVREFQAFLRTWTKQHP